MHAIINETSHLESLTHRVEFIGGAHVSQKGRHDDGVAQPGERVNELVETRGRLGFGLGGNYLARCHSNMIACYYATMQVIPALDLLGDDAVRLEQGDYERVLFRQPIEEFMGRIVATDPPLIHVVDLQGARDGALRLDMVQRCVGAAGVIPLQVSGGIRSVETARWALDAGASRVIVGTALWSNPEAMVNYVNALGVNLVAAIDVRGGYLAVRGWLSSSGLRVEEALDHCVDAGVSRLHVTAIERDGTMQGPDLSLYEQVCASGIPVVAAGGVRDDNDVALLEAIGCEAAIMGLGYLKRLGLDVSDN
jgi:phosphoribosylformimino-5-aminoimidazole carboxamide ribotide isomerase